MGEYNAKVLAELQNTQWAIDPEVLTGMVGAVTVDMGPQVKGARAAYKNGNVGFVDVNGPIVSRDSWIAQFFGLNSVEQISADLRQLEADGEVTDIVLLMDSPGGAVNGLLGLTEQIASSSKRTTVYASGAMASAAYWFGSAANNIVASETALVGSIGVVATVTPWAKQGEVTVVSSQSPKKRLDPGSKEGLSALQKIVDGLAEVFIDTVAKNRGVTSEKVLAEYGQGEMFLAKDALERGMIDGVASLNDLVSSLTAANSGKTEKGKIMDLKTLQAEHADVFDAAVKIGVTAERKRAEAHLIMGEASGDLATAIEAIKKGDDMDALYTAKYQAAGMKKAQTAARAADNPVGVTGQADTTPGKSEADLVAEAVLESMSYYTEGLEVD